MTGEPELRDRLIASMALIHHHVNGLELPDDRGAIDWHEHLDGGGRRVEMIVGRRALHLDLSWAEWLELHAALTLTLLKDIDDC